MMPKEAIDSSQQGHSRAPVGYVMTHYPKLAQTFIANEIEAVERAGVPIRCFAMNPPDAIEKSRPGADGKIARTIYLKPKLARGFLALLRQSLRHPLAMAGVWRKALASGGGHMGRTLRRMAHLAQAALVADAMRHEKIDRLHAHFGLAPATIAWLACGIARAQGRMKADFSFTIHGFHDFFDPRETRLDLKARDAKAVLCISDFTRSQLYLTTPSALWKKFHVARCGIDTVSFAFRSPNPWPAEPTIMALGRLSAEKGFAVLIEAIARLRSEGQGFRLKIIGDGPMRDELEALARQQGISGNVTFTGEQTPTQVSQELSQSDIFCMASFSEGLPISIMEAMAVGVPVVTTWISGIPELARDRQTALTVPPASASALADAIKELCDNPPLREHIIGEARKLVEQQHNLNHCGSIVADFLRDKTP